MGTKAKAPALKREAFLKLPEVSAFCSYFEALIAGQTFKHDYRIRWKQWSKDRNLTVLKISSLKFAYRAYYWPTNSQSAADTDGEEIAHQAGGTQGSGYDFDANTARLRRLQRELKSALDARSEDAAKAFMSALKILDWGQVYRGAAGWLIQEFERDQLPARLRRAIAILDGKSLEDTREFEGTWSLRMDSGLTKVYSLGSKRSIIYDDRVGAGLGLLVRRFLVANPAHRFKGRGKNRVPPELRFMRGSSSRRNPSTAIYKFPLKKTGRGQAESNLKANWILRKVVKDKKVWGLRTRMENCGRSRQHYLCWAMT